MCKHILFNQFNYEKDIETLKNFADMSYERDGYGAIIKKKDGEIYTYKDLNEGSFYITLTQFLIDIKDDIDTLVVHHRTSTNKHGIEYTHPFEYNGHYLTHNGVINTPYKYDTKTSNDSEELLHHLVDTDYSTEDISGYYSTFIVTKDKVQLVVDDTAPIYTNGRIYSSHNLSTEGDKWKRIKKKHIIFKDGVIESIKDIKIKVSAYGMDKAHKSLGKGYTKGTNIYDATTGKDYGSDYWNKEASKYSTTEVYDTASDFFALLNKHEDAELCGIASSHELETRIWDLSLNMGLWLGEKEVLNIVDMYLCTLSTDGYKKGG